MVLGGESVIRNGSSTFWPQAGLHVHPGQVHEHPGQVQEHPARVQITVNERNRPRQREGTNYLALSGWSAGSEMVGAPNRNCGLKATEWWIYRWHNWWWYFKATCWNGSHWIWTGVSVLKRKLAPMVSENHGTDRAKDRSQLQWETNMMKLNQKS